MPRESCWRIDGARVPVQVVLHGGLAVIRNRRARNPLKRVVDTQSALELGRSKYLQYLVMEKCIRRMFFKIMPSLADSVDVLEHPFPIAETGPERLALEAPVRFWFGFLGKATESKGFELFRQLAETVRMSAPGKAEFHAIGPLGRLSNCGDLSALDRQPEREMLVRSEYVKGLKQMHYICFPYRSAHYELSVSGSVLDAVAFSKPMLAARLPIFADLFNRFGDLGDLSDGPEEWKKTLLRIVSKPYRSRYRLQQDAMESLQRSRSISALA